MRWTKLGLITPPSGAPWARSHAMIPTPFATRRGALRVYYSACDLEGRGRPAFVEVDAQDPLRVVSRSEQPLLDLGRPGCFDDNGIVVTSVLRGRGDEVLMYYVGFELCHHVRYRLFTGLAVSADDGDTFRRFSEAPVLDRSNAEVYFRCGPFVRFEGSVFRMWYIAGSDWTKVGGKQVPVYDLRTAVSEDGRHWPPEGERLLSLSDPDEHGFGRPWVIPGAESDELFFSVRKRSLGQYRLGYGRIRDGRVERDDMAMGLDVSKGGFDSQAIMYLAVIDLPHARYGFYNGNDYGRDGIGVAVSER